MPRFYKTSFFGKKVFLGLCSDPAPLQVTIKGMLQDPGSHFYYICELEDKTIMHVATNVVEYITEEKEEVVTYTKRENVFYLKKRI